jgi:hypothetical protein
MTVNPLTLNRLTLYDLVWSKPLVDMAKEFNMSDGGLAKRCRAVDVPVPYRGYWARKAAGQEPHKTPLPKYRGQDALAAAKGRGETVPTTVIKEGPEPAVDFEPLPKKADKENVPSSPAEKATYAQIDAIEVSPWKMTDTMHAAVKRSAIALAAYRVKDFSWTKLDRNGSQIEIEVSEEAKVRALQVANLIVKGCDCMAWGIIEEEKSARVPRWGASTVEIPVYALLEVEGEPMRFRIDERRRQVPHQITREERERSWGSPPPWDLVPTGDLRVHLCEKSRWAFKTFKDGTRRLLEEQLSSILRALYDRSQELKCRREEQRLEEERRRSREKREALAAERRESQYKLVEELERQAFSWHRARLLRRYLSAAQRAVGDRSIRASMQTRSIDFLAWCESYVDQLDPLSPTPYNEDQRWRGRLHGEDEERAKAFMRRYAGLESKAAWKLVSDEANCGEKPEKLTTAQILGLE